MIGCCQAAGLARSEPVRLFSARLPSENTNEAAEPRLATNGFILGGSVRSSLKGQFTQTTKTWSVLGPVPSGPADTLDLSLSVLTHISTAKVDRVSLSCLRS